MLIKLKNIQKTYASKNGITFRALSNVSATFDSTGITFIVGQSGSGKSTLLNVIGGLDDFDSGEYILAGRNVKSLKHSEVDSLRNTLMGFVFQEFNLIDTLSVYENVKLALDMQSNTNKDAVMEALEKVGIADKARNKATNMSGGQRQRIAIARALVKNPQIILADEPTGALDSVTGEAILNILKDLSKTRLVIVVTHDMDFATKYGDRIIEMKDGKIYRDVRKRLPDEKREKSETILYSDTLLAVPADAKVTDGDVEKINEIIKDSSRKTYINVDTNQNRVKALFPQLREAVDESQDGKSDARKASSDKDELSEEKFVPYTPKQEEDREFEYKKSRLPVKHCARLALNNLNHKKAMLILTIIIAFVAFTLFGAAESFSFYNVNRAMADSIYKENMSTIAARAAAQSGDDYYTQSAPTRITDNDIENIKTKAPFATFDKGYDISLGLSQQLSGQGEFASGFSGFSSVVETDDVKKLGRSVFAGSGTCNSFNEVLISRFAARALREGEAVVSDSDDVTGKQLSLNGLTYTIAGVFDTKNEFEKFIDYDYRDENYSVYSSLVSGVWSQVVVKTGFIKNYIDNDAALDYEYAVEYKSGSADDNGGSKAKLVTLDKLSDSQKSAITAVTSGAISAKSDVIISLSAAQNAFGISGDTQSVTAALRQLNANQKRKLVVSKSVIGGAVVWASGNFTVTGIIDDAQFTDDGNIMIISDELKTEIVKASVYPTTIYINFTPTKANALSVVNGVDDCGLKINESFVTMYDMVLAVISTLRIVLMVIAVILLLLVVFLINSYISSSIKLTRKNIGILRALGAKKSDTFKIYAVEGLMMTLIALLAAIIALIVLPPIINSGLSASFGGYLTFISIGWEVYLTLALLALGVAALSIIFPLNKFNKITPVAAISGKE